MINFLEGLFQEVIKSTPILNIFMSKKQYVSHGFLIDLLESFYLDLVAEYKLKFFAAIAILIVVIAIVIIYENT